MHSTTELWVARRTKGKKLRPEWRDVSRGGHENKIAWLNALVCKANQRMNQIGTHDDDVRKRKDFYKEKKS